MSRGLIDQLKLDAASAGIDTFGVCNLEELADSYPDVFEGLPQSFTRALVFGIPVPAACLAGIVDRPTLIYFHHYRQLNYILDRFAIQVSLAVEQTGSEALAVPASQVTSWRPVPRGHISHKLLAAAAGLGWWGRNNLLVTPRHGSRIRLASVLTNLQIKTSNAPVKTECGSCKTCISACPAGAIAEDPADFNAELCSQKLAEFSKMQFIGQRICGVCVKACGPKQDAANEERN